MNLIKLKARAKINLSLDVLGKRKNGYHDVKMIMQLIELYDRIVVEIIPEGIEVTASNTLIPTGSMNTAYKAAELMREKYRIKKGIRIKIIKKIPVAAGLAGGSADAAAVIKGINQLLQLEIGENELMEIGGQVGADVPYCLKGGTALAEGVGEVLTQLRDLPQLSIVLVKPKIKVSTKWVYENLDLGEIVKRPDTNRLIKAIEDGDIGAMCHNMANVLEIVTTKKYPVITDIKRKLIKLGAEGSMMSGSGPTVFGVFNDKKAARYAYNKIKSHRWYSYLTETHINERR